MKLFLVIALLLPLALEANAQKPEWVKTNTLVYGRGDDSLSLDPAYVDDGESVKVIETIYETLLRVGAGGRLEPWLATRWSVLDGFHGYVFTIRKNVWFHDGTPMTPAAVAASLNRLLASRSPYLTFYQTIKRVSAAGQQVRVETSKPDATLPYNLAMFPASIVSSAAVKRHGRLFGPQVAVGTGPFKLTRWQKDVVVEVARFKGYWGKKARVTRIEFRKVRDDRKRLALLRSGHLSYMDGLNPRDIKGVMSDPKLVLKMSERGHETSLLYLAFNTQSPPLRQRQVPPGGGPCAGQEGDRRTVQRLGQSARPPGPTRHQWVLENRARPDA